MPVNTASVVYATAGGIILYAGAKGATVQATVKSALKGNLNPPDTQHVSISALLGDVAGAFGLGLLGGNSGGSGGSSGASITAGSSSADAQANQATAKQVMKKLGKPYSDWTSGQNWDDLVLLWTKESGWNAKAENSASGALGIAQALPPTKYPKAGQKPELNPGAQITWGLEYIHDRYGSPVMAWAHEQANNWY